MAVVGELLYNHRGLTQLQAIVSWKYAIMLFIRMLVEAGNPGLGQGPLLESQNRVFWRRSRGHWV
jgi:hypothetical protein